MKLSLGQIETERVCTVNRTAVMTNQKLVTNCRIYVVQGCTCRLQPVVHLGVSSKANSQVVANRSARSPRAGRYRLFAQYILHKHHRLPEPLSGILTSSLCSLQEAQFQAHPYNHRFPLHQLQSLPSFFFLCSSRLENDSGGMRSVYLFNGIEAFRFTASEEDGEGARGVGRRWYEGGTICAGGRESRRVIEVVGVEVALLLLLSLSTRFACRRTYL